jgi:hypothetical protein
MKIKSDFVTNSSSTSFFFIFNGDKNDLFELIKKNNKSFDLSYKYTDNDNETKTDENFIIESINNVINKKHEFLKTVEVKNIDFLIEELKNEYEYFVEVIQQSSTKLIDYEREILNEINNKIIICKKAKENGLTNYLKIEFGDNHGHVANDQAGVIDYYQPIILSKDFIMINQNNH